MPVTKEELARAIRLLKELSVKATEPEHGMDESMVELLQRASEAVSSNLFAKLIDIQNILQKVDLDDRLSPLSDELHQQLSLYDDDDDDDDPSLTDEHNYGDTSDTDGLIQLDEELTPAPILPPPLPPPLPSHGESTIDERGHQLPATTPLEATRSLTTTDNNGPPHMVESSSTCLLTKQQADDNLSDGPPSFSKGVVDLLSPMRDSKTLSAIKEAIHGKYGRDRRSVSLVQTPEGLGIELVGLSRTGVFIGSLSSDRVAAKSDVVQVGDQILEINGNSADNMASFELVYQIEQIPVGSTIVLTVTYNPTGSKGHQPNIVSFTGLKDYQRQNSK